MESYSSPTLAWAAAEPLPPNSTQQQQQAQEESGSSVVLGQQHKLTGALVVVGCDDRNLYAFHAQNGSIAWVSYVNGQVESAVSFGLYLPPLHSVCNKASRT